jgi:hypothetical protein
MNGALDVHPITRIWPCRPTDIEWCEPDERGHWPVIAFVDDGRPIVFAVNLN